MTLFNAKFRHGCEYLHETARRHWGQRFLGRQIDRRCAGGSEFVGHSDYTCGDDFRYVDWQVCARHDELITKQFRGSEDQCLYVLLDCSAGMRLGDPPKFDAARRLAGALGYMGLAALDSVSIVAASDRILSEMPSSRGRHRLPRLFDFLDIVV